MVSNRTLWEGVVFFLSWDVVPGGVCTGVVVVLLAVLLAVLAGTGTGSSTRSNRR